MLQTSRPLSPHRGLFRGVHRAARAGPLAAADALAGLLGFELGEAHIHGEPVLGLASGILQVPWPPLALREVAARAGVALAFSLARPTLACYGRPRRARADGLAGPAGVPVPGWRYAKIDEVQAITYQSRPCFG